jgi:hypothetical protein
METSQRFKFFLILLVLTLLWVLSSLIKAEAIEYKELFRVFEMYTKFGLSCRDQGNLI